jgi:predicted nucleic acid-binding protein
MIYVDSSLLVSSYVDDAHSQEADRRMSTAPEAWLTPLNRAELAHALHQYVFRGQLSLAEIQHYWKTFEQDCAQGVWIAVKLPERIWETSIDLARRYGPALGVRTLDSLHVACALDLRAERFWTFDERQARLAEAVGLNTRA